LAGASCSRAGRPGGAVKRGADDLEAARHKLAAKDEAMINQQADLRRRDSRIALLDRMAPEDFTRAMEAHRRDGNTELEVRDAHS